MTPRRLSIVDGPDKPALQRSLAHSGVNDVHFRVEGDAFDADIQRMDEEADGFTFKLLGRLTSGRDRGASFHGVYSIESRSGWLELGDK